MVIRTHQDEVVQLGEAAVFPMPNVVRVQATSRAATGHRTRGVTVLEGTTKAPVDHPSRPARADDLPVAFEPHLADGVAGQILALGVGEQRPQMQRGDPVFDVQMHHHRGVLPMGSAGGVGVPPGLDQPHERLTGTRHRRPLICGALATVVTAIVAVAIVAVATVAVAIVAVGIVVIAIVVIGIVVIVLPLGDQRIMMGLQRRVERRGVGVTKFDPVVAERLVGGLGDRALRLGPRIGSGSGGGSSLTARSSWLTVATRASCT